MLSSPNSPSQIEEGLRRSAPLPPPSLKSRTLANCAARVLVQQQRRQHLHRHLTWAIVGLLAMQSLTLFVLDAQNTQLLAGNSSPPTWASLSLAQMNELWQQRSHQLAQLLDLPKMG